MPPPLPSPSLFSELRELSFKLSKSPTTISAAFQSVELDAQDLESFVRQELPQHLEGSNNDDYNGGVDSALFRNLQHQVRQLSRHAQQNKSNTDNKNEPALPCPNHPNCALCSPEFIGEIILSLRSVIESTPSLSARATAEIHSMIGLLRHRKADAQGAIRSFLRVLWIQSYTKSTPTFTTTDSDRSIDKNNSTDDSMMLWKMGLTRHRLAMAFASTGNLTDAVKLLERALSDYNEHQNNASTSSLKSRRIVVEQAETDWKLAKLMLTQQKPKSHQRRRNVRRSSTSVVDVKRMANANMRRSSSA